ncbi:hypothetical protein B484DRAFT_390208, partial [Ochromonadaceae sp. CCMP2298]
MLTVIFFARTLYLERITSTLHPELYSKRSFGQTSDGYQYQDCFKVVVEVKAYTKPPPLVETVMSAIMILFG